MEQKPKIFNLKNFIVSDTGRLSSLTVKRDLSLGGNKQKKVYKPNLNVVRNKNKAKAGINNKNQQYQNKRNSRSLSNKNNQNHQYIQSASVFSEGAGELRRPKIYSDRYMNYGERDQTTAAMPKIIKTKWEVDVKEEKSVVDELLADEDDSSSETEEDYSPVILPLKNNKVGFLKTYQVKKEDPDKKEIKEEMPLPLDLPNGTINNILNYDIPLSFQDNKFYNDDHPCISLFRMPDSLPGKGFAEDSDRIIDFDLSQMTEGKIGKISARKSGRVEIQIGCMKYVVDSIESNPFKEDLMYIPENLKSTTFGPDMVNLGNIDEKYILSPSWKNLFDLRNVKKK